MKNNVPFHKNSAKKIQAISAVRIFRANALEILRTYSLGVTGTIAKSRSRTGQGEMVTKEEKIATRKDYPGKFFSRSTRYEPVTWWTGIGYRDRDETFSRRPDDARSTFIGIFMAAGCTRRIFIDPFCCSPSMLGSALDLSAAAPTEIAIFIHKPRLEGARIGRIIKPRIARPAVADAPFALTLIRRWPRRLCYAPFTVLFPHVFLLLYLYPFFLLSFPHISSDPVFHSFGISRSFSKIYLFSVGLNVIVRPGCRFV